MTPDSEDERACKSHSRRALRDGPPLRGQDRDLAMEENMSEIQGFGPTQPLRSAAPATRPAAPRAVESDASYAGYGSDDVQVSSLGIDAVPSPTAAAAPAAPVAAPAPRVETPVLAEIDGFMIAGAGQSASGLSAGADTGRAFSAGPIAMIDEPGPATVEFPDLSLNGPSTAFEGLFGLSGARLA